MKFSLIPILLGTIANAQEIMVEPMQEIELDVDVDYYGEEQFEPSSEIERLSHSKRQLTHDDDWVNSTTGEQVMMVVKSYGGEV